jgi:OOP family OmpA-OmpF porin
MVAREPEVSAGNRWQELRALIVGPERARLKEVEHKLDDPWIHAEEVSRVLPEAVTRRSKDGELGQALAPILGDAITTSVRRDPKPLVDAIFPIIGPAIRRAMASAFSELIQSINATMEHSLTPRGLRWRMEALRTGRSFGEVVLSHSLVYRVEQLFLVHRNTGLLISHQTAAGVRAQSPEMVSGMLTAITDFVRDSFHVEGRS